MPELPAVEYTRRLIEDNAINSRIISMDPIINSQFDEIIFSTRSINFIKSISQYRIEKVRRWGKQLWIILHKDISDRNDEKDRIALLIHLGMTGFVQFRGGSRLKYESSPSKSEKDTNLWPPRFAKFTMKIEGDKEMAFCDARRLAKIDILELNEASNEADFYVKDILGLGFDPLLSMPPFEDFNDQFSKLQSKRKINIKTLLMEQKFIAGLGNWMVDDVLMLARIHPKRTISSLTEKEVLQLHKSIKELCRISVEANSDQSKFPKGWLFHIRWNHGTETLTGLHVKFEKISGRTTFWIPKFQKECK